MKGQSSASKAHNSVKLAQKFVSSAVGMSMASKTQLGLSSCYSQEISKSSKGCTTNFVVRLFLQLPVLLLFVQIRSQFSQTNGMISCNKIEREDRVSCREALNRKSPVALCSSTPKVETHYTEHNSEDFVIHDHWYVHITMIVKRYASI